MVDIINVVKVVAKISVDEIQGIPWEKFYCCVFLSVCIDIWIQARKYLSTLITIQTHIE